MRTILAAAGPMAAAPCVTIADLFTVISLASESLSTFAIAVTETS